MGDDLSARRAGGLLRTNTTTMSAFAARPLVFSVLLHGSVIGGLLVLMLRLQQAPAPTPFIVDWVPAPATPVPGDTPTTAMMTATSSIRFTPVRVPVPARVPEVEPVAETAPTPAPAPRPRTTATAATSAVSPPPASRTTITDHRRRNPLPSTSSATARSSAQQAAPTRARIDMDQVLAAAPSSSPSGPRAASADPAQAASYWDALLGKLRAAHQKPAGLDDGLVALVEFVLRADGTIGDVRVLNSSGSAEFDASVVAAFRRLTGLGAPPAGKVGLNQVTFRTRAE